MSGRRRAGHWRADPQRACLRGRAIRHACGWTYPRVVLEALEAVDDVGELVDRLSTTPLTPVIAWGSADVGRLAIGLGDVLLAALFPIVQRKTFGQFAGVAALTVSVGA